MKSKTKVRDHCEAQCVLGNKTTSGFKLSGMFDVECFRNGERIWEEHNHNIVTTEGLNAILNGVFKPGAGGFTVPATWFVGLVNTDTAPAANMTYHAPSFTESADYDNIAVRSTYVPNAASSAGSISNSSSPSTFTMSGTPGTIYGAALFSLDTRADHTEDVDVNALYCYSRFTAGRVVVADDVINVTYSITAIDDA
jgi:hypothetical protein